MGPYLVAAAAGLLFLPFLPALPPLWLAPALASSCFLFAFFSRWQKVFLLAALLCSTLSWSVWSATRAVEARLPHALEGVTLEATGWVRGMPEPGAFGLRFRFEPVAAMGPQDEAVPVAGHWHLFSAGSESPWPDGRCRLTVRLKRPHGVVNPGGFDAEAWLLSEGITASGSVRHMACEPPVRVTVDGLRAKLRDTFLREFPENLVAGVVLSLITGDRSQVPLALWERYVATGVVHLMAISGLHITLIAVVVAAGLRVLLGFVPGLALRLPPHKPALVAGFLAAWAYSLMAGYSVPTERTLIMLAVVLSMQALDRHLPAFQVLLLAMIAVLLWSPLAVHATGFWLSFGAVAILLMLGHVPGSAGWWRQVVGVQFVLTLLLLPLTLWFFERASWVSPFANLLAVPLVTFVVVPLGLLGLVGWLLGGNGLALLCWKTAIALMAVLDALLEQFQSWPGAGMAWSLAGGTALLWLVLAVLVIIQPAQRRLWCLLPVLALALSRPPLAPAADVLRVTVLDVGQGLSVLLQTRHHRLLYDTGPPLGPATDAGERHVLPSLRRLGVYRLDRLVLSHDDNDHTGGAASVLAGMTVGDVLGPKPASVSQAVFWQPCRAGLRWVWDGWLFEALYPTEDESLAASNDNNRSCVLRVSRGERAVLLPGDLEHRGEHRLLERLPEEAVRADVLVLGHHGSRNASSLPWVAAVSPAWAIASAGYRNSFRHPSEALVKRLEATGVRWRNTADSGALVMELSAVGAGAPEGWRTTAPRYWRERPREQQDHDAQAFFEHRATAPMLGGDGHNPVK